MSNTRVGKRRTTFQHENTPARNKARVAQGKSSDAPGMQSRAPKKPNRGK